LTPEIFCLISAPEIVAVIGTRQAGKTTLLKHLQAGIQDSSFLTFEDIKIRELFDVDTKSFVELYIKPALMICIDEFQHSRKGGQGLKYIYDNVPPADRAFILNESLFEDLRVGKSTVQWCYLFSGLTLE